MNLPIPSSVPRPSVAPAASSAQQDDPASQAGDPFGSMLASQLAGDAAATGKSSSTASTDALIAAANGKKDSKQHAADAANTPAADILAALIAVPATSAAAKPVLAAASSGSSAIGTRGNATPDDAANAALQLSKTKTAVDANAKSAATADANANDKVANDKAQNFASTLQTLGDKGRHNAQSLAAQHKTAPLPQDNIQAAPTQPAQINPQMANAAVPSSQLALDTPVGSRNWGSDLGQKITWLSTQNQHSAELHLNPPDLGPLNVVLNVDGSHASAMFTSAHAAVRDAVQQALPQLREMMANNGIMLGNATVSDQRPDNRDGQAPQRSSRLASAGDADNSISGLNQSAPALPVSRHNGIVDTFA